MIAAPLPFQALTQLDAVQHLPDLEGLAPASFLAALAAELAPPDQTLEQLQAQLDALTQTLGSIETFAQKAMAIRLTHVLAMAPVPPQLRTLLATTVTSYAGELGLLRQRFARALPAAVLAEVLTAAEQVLALRQALRDGLLTLVRQVAARQLPWLQQAARDRSLPDPERLRLRLACFDLQQVAEQPERLALLRCAERMKALRLPDEEPEPEDPDAPQGQRFALLEID